VKKEISVLFLSIYQRKSESALFPYMEFLLDRIQFINDGKRHQTCNVT